MYSKSLALIGLVAVVPAAAFAPSVSSSIRRCNLSLGASSDSNDERRTSPSDAIRGIAAVSALTVGLLFPSSEAVASMPPSTVDHVLHSSSVEVSASITTMDFSMPSSYDSIADPVASGKDELTKTEVINTSASKRKTSSASSSGLSPKEEAAAARAERVAQRKAKEEEQAVLDAQAAKERDEAIKQARMEKAAARAAAQKEKEAAAAAEAEEAKFKGAKFIDTSMPSY